MLAFLKRLRTPAQALILFAGITIFTLVAHYHYPIQHWLFWRYAGYWLACAIWAAACASFGHVIVKRVLTRTLPFREHLGTSFATGVFAFYVLMTVAGLFHAYGKALFFALPAAMLAAGGRSLARATRRYLRAERAFFQAGSQASPGHRRVGRDPRWTYAILAFGLIGLAMVYFIILTPENVQFDSRWKHFALAEQYVASGGVRRFPEGWTVETNPHLATYVYTWGFMLPFGRLFDRVELAAHLEFTVFLATTLMLPALVRRLVPGTSARFAWVSRFLFPGVFLYDSSLSGGADHIAALFTLPMFSLLLRARRDLSPRLCALSAVMLAGGAMTKLTGLLMLVPVPVAVLGGSAIVIAVRRNSPSRRNAWLGPLVALLVGLAVTSTHWLKNWIWYGDPLYPSLHKYLTLRPWTVDSADLFEWGYKEHQFWRPTRDVAGVKKTLGALFTFSFIPNDWGRFHGAVPVFGSLFTLLAGCLPFLKRTGKLWALTGATYLGIVVWYWTHHQDRYLQTLVPWMAAVTAGVAILLWRSGLLQRTLLAILIGFQIIWGGNVYFNPTHAMVQSPQKAVLDLLATGQRKDYEGRLKVFTGYVDLGKQIPPGGRVLLHDNHVHLGVAASTVSDWGAWQFGISYGRQGTPREVYNLLMSMGVTHIAWQPARSAGWDSLAGDIMFFDFAFHEAKERKSAGDFLLAKMPPAPPSAPFNDAVVFLGCNTMYKSGLYAVRDLTVPVFGPKSEAYPEPSEKGPPQGATAEALAAKTNILVLDEKCQKALPGFELAARRRVVRNGKGTAELTIWFRTGKQTPPAPIAPPPRSQPLEDDDLGAGNPK